MAGFSKMRFEYPSLSSKNECVIERENAAEWLIQLDFQEVINPLFCNTNKHC